MTNAAILCERDESGVCRHCGHKARRLPHYRACTAFAQPAPAVQSSASRPPRPAAGPGTELKSLLARVGIKASPTCSCNARARLMDENEARTPGWCADHLDEIVGWLREEATKRGLPFLDAAGRVLVRRAIANARRKEQARGQASAQAEGGAAG